MIVATLFDDEGSAVAILDSEAAQHARWLVPPGFADADELDSAMVSYFNLAFDPDDIEDIEGRHRPWGVAVAERVARELGYRLELAPIKYLPNDGRIS